MKLWPDSSSKWSYWFYNIKSGRQSIWLRDVDNIWFTVIILNSNFIPRLHSIFPILPCSSRLEITNVHICFDSDEKYKCFIKVIVDWIFSFRKIDDGFDFWPNWENILVSVTTFLIPQLGSADQLTKSVDEQPTNFDTLDTYLINWVSIFVELRHR